MCNQYIRICINRAICSFATVHVKIDGQWTTCVFPFNHGGRTYDTCALLDPTSNELRCRTAYRNRIGHCFPGELTSLHCLYCKFKHYQKNVMHIAVTNPLYSHGLNARKKFKTGKLNNELILLVSITVVISNIYAPV